ncbi:hypothetical protein FHR83_008165 [Actinoplanes campanulatus]|uniref:Uncharacterized protein n=1 Tax=Actinoplanes campanulatus TaxID=113559 RepID=A0A7W5AQ80_9ACTN|nr:hypothetical protein [Actinoplanes campanulatus]MBB3100443.1 hypothetical protein [Actinoplanes campanulatus]GGN24855.1 hypothetical protein GCM10010109_40700 [Actinoplanes campanulatus]GID39519.1 hypothetical protein Aca09nite_60250 [Actinoplanes campanulatus]
MSQDSPAESVISFGASERRSFLRDLGRDHRLPLLTAALAAVAAFGSLISEWQTTDLEGLAYGDGSLPGQRVVQTELVDMGAAGGGYLIGLFLLTITVVLTLLGPTEGRRYARLAGLATGGLLLAVLVTLVPVIADTSLIIPKYFLVDLADENLTIAPGRGLWCAFAAVILAMAALRLPEPRRREIAEPAPVETAFPDDLDLSIGPTAPFASLPGELDQPHRS